MVITITAILGKKNDTAKMDYLTDDFINVMKVMTDLNRLRIFALLYSANYKLTKNEITNSMKHNRQKVLIDLKILQQSGLVKNRQYNHKTYYFLSKINKKLRRILFGLVSTVSDKILLQDTKRLKNQVLLKEKR